MWETHEFPQTSKNASTSRVLRDTSPLKHPPSHMAKIAPEYSAPTLSLLPIPRQPETKDGKRLYNWRLRKFSNDARVDTKDGKNSGLKLKHWSKVTAKQSKTRDGEDEEMATSDDEELPPSSSDEEAEDEGRYPFAKYTVQTPTVYSYTSEEYATYVEDATDSGWTKEETDYLFKLLQDYNVRFYIVLDRYEYAGTTESPPVKRELEDLKDRYYSVVRKLIRARAGDKPEDQKASEGLLLCHGFDREQEKMRRQHIAGLWNRTPAQILEETLLYTELMRLSQTATAFTAQRHKLLRLLAGIESGLPDIQTRDDRLAALNMDPQIRGVKGGLWGNVLSGLNSAGPSAGGSRKKRAGGHASVDWGESPTHVGGNMMISLGGASSARQLLPPAQQAEYGESLDAFLELLSDYFTDAKHCIYRAPPGSTLINSKNTHIPVHARSSKFPVAKPILASHLQAVSASAEGSSSQPPQPPTIFAKLDIHPSKLAMPTKENLEWMERVFGAASQWVEVQKQLERVEAELSTQRKRLGLAEPTSGGSAKIKTEDGMEGVTTTEGAGRSSSRKRSLSASSNESNNKRQKT